MPPPWTKECMQNVLIIHLLILKSLQSAIENFSTIFKNVEIVYLVKHTNSRQYCT